MIRNSPMGGPAGLTFVFVACAYALGLCPAMYWLDSSELAAAGFELGVAHAPGQPLALLLFRMFDYLPLGDAALRAGLSQAVCGAGAAAVLAWIGARLARRFTTDATDALVADALGVAAGLLYASSYAAAFQALRPEVYALSALLVLGTIALCLRFVEDPAPRHLGLAGLLFGLGLTNHHYLTLLGAAPPALALVLPSLRRGRDGRDMGPTLRGLGGGAIAVALALCIYAYLPLRAAHDPVVDWGHPTTAATFFWVVSARSFQKSFGSEAVVGGEDDLPALVGALLDQLTPAAALLALAGLYLVLRRAPRLGLALLFMLGGPIGARLAVRFDAGNPDAYGYLSTGIAALALLTIPLFALVAELAPKLGRAVAGLALVGVAARAAVVAPSLSLRRFDEARPVFARLLAQQPAGALAITSYFQTTFAFDYLRVAEETRPDLRYVARHFLSQPGERAALLARAPELAPLLGARDVDADALLATRRPFFLEYDLDLAPRLAPYAAIVPVPRSEAAELQTRRFAIWQDLLLYHRLCVLGSPEPQRSEVLATLRAHTAGDSADFIDELAARCPSLARPD